MRRLITAATSPRLQVWIAGLALLLWLILWPITMGSRLATSLSWLTNASLFANVATCFGWWVTSLVQLRTERIEESSTQAATLAHIEAMEERILARLEAGDAAA